MADLIDMLATILSLILFGRIIVSWMVALGRLSPYSPIAKTLFDLTEPFLAPIRNLLPQTAGFDLSPLIAFIIIQIVRTLLIQMVA
ncbi:MAG: YggT family protein [Chloroflexi bacterium]|nr:YggT family protein [Anaerolineae bacterium]MCQ3931729.1 YggT family protein [Chloroflexota bacterium]